MNFFELKNSMFYIFRNFFNKKTNKFEYKYIQSHLLLLLQNVSGVIVFACITPLMLNVDPAFQNNITFLLIVRLNSLKILKLPKSSIKFILLYFKEFIEKSDGNDIQQIFRAN